MKTLGWYFYIEYQFSYLTGAIYTWRHKLNFWEFADIMAPSIIFGQAIGRIACLLNGDAYGSPTGSNFGLVYPEGTMAHNAYGSQPYGHSSRKANNVHSFKKKIEQAFSVNLALTSDPNQKDLIKYEGIRTITTSTTTKLQIVWVGVPEEKLTKTSKRYKTY
jgi:hypothetical protein